MTPKTIRDNLQQRFELIKMNIARDKAFHSMSKAFSLRVRDNIPPTDLEVIDQYVEENGPIKVTMPFAL